MIDSVIAKGKVRQAIERLGLSFLDCQHLVSYHPETETAYWSYNKKTGREKICVGSLIASLDVSSIEMVLRHEFLHRATYNGFCEKYSDSQLLNIVEDVCINRMLYEAYPEEMEKLSQHVYPPESKKTIIALADCTAHPGNLPDKIASLWRFIWEKDENKFFSALNPSSLYYRLMDIRSTREISFEYDINVLSEHGNSFPSQPSAQVGKAIGKTIGGVNGRMPGNSESGKMMNTFLGTPVQFDQDKIRRFLDSLDVDRLVSASRDDLLETVRYHLHSVYPYYPTRRGITYLSTGLSDLLGIYHIEKTDIRPYRLKVAFYVDVSGSMEDYFSHVHSFVKAVFDIPLVVKIFDKSLREVTVEAFKEGQYSVGGGTDFDIVIRDLLDDDTLGAGILFTDGEAEIDTELMEKIAASGKKVFAVYFTEKGGIVGDCDLSSIAQKSITMNV